VLLLMLQPQFHTAPAGVFASGPIPCEPLQKGRPAGNPPAGARRSPSAINRRLKQTPFRTDGGRRWRPV